MPGGMDAGRDRARGRAEAARAVARSGRSPCKRAESILAGIGRYNPWVRHGPTYAAIPEGEDMLTVGINRAVALLADREIRDSRAKGPKRVLRELGPHPRSARR